MSAVEAQVLRPTFSGQAALTATAFDALRRLLHTEAGIHLSDAKQTLVSSRLGKRLAATGCACYDDYLRLIQADRRERQMAVDLLTTNETYFFREEKHFEFLSRQILPRHPAGSEFSVWSAASSSGEEAYSVAMVLAEAMGESGWRIFGSDISTKVLHQAQRAVYPMQRASRIPEAYLKRFCLKGVDEHDGYFAIVPRLRKRVGFDQLNLMEPPKDLGQFDLILLRNVMIYFQPETKRTVVRHLIRHLKPGGYLFIGHSESLFGINEELTAVAPAIYRKNR